MARMELCCCVAMCCCCCTCCQPKKAVTERKYKPGSGAFKEPLLDKVYVLYIFTHERFANV
eukprot:591670-Amorphochlora_amoeboformis.AAC.3